MRHALAIARRELESYFFSPIAYAVLAIFTFVSGLFFTNMLVYYMRQSAIADSHDPEVRLLRLPARRADGRAGAVLPERSVPAHAGACRS